jgi:hypothetical protein
MTFKQHIQTRLLHTPEVLKQECMGFVHTTYVKSRHKNTSSSIVGNPCPLVRILVKGHHFASSHPNALIKI